jgi:hypothetical protein
MISSQDKIFLAESMKVVAEVVPLKNLSFFLAKSMQAVAKVVP